MVFNSVFKERHKKIHLVGIGGIGMSGIARVLIESGFFVSGSDLVESNEITKLKMLGAKISIGHHQKNVSDADVLVFSAAVPFDNPEIKKAEQLNIPIIPRAIMLAELMRLRCGIAVSGTHGKTTTTSLIATLMHKLGIDPTVVIGGIVNHFGTNAVLGKSQFMVTEADESDGTFLHLCPTIAVATNIDSEHLDFYKGGICEIKHNFLTFLNSLPFYGLAVVCIDDKNIKEIVPSINRRITTYGFNEDAMYSAKNLQTIGFSTTFDLIKNRQFITRMTVNMVGCHNILNTLAAIAVLEEIGVKCLALKEILSTFNGIKRRFSPVRPEDGFMVIDDYAHHPTEIEAVLKAAKISFNDKKIRVLFQPHRFSRTKNLMTEFSLCFNCCDSLIISDIYPAAEKPIAGITSSLLIEKIKKSSNAKALYTPNLDQAAKKIVAQANRNDVILVLGAGSVTKAAPMIVDLLKEKFGEVNGYKEAI